VRWRGGRRRGFLNIHESELKCRSVSIELKTNPKVLAVRLERKLKSETRRAVPKLISFSFSSIPLASLIRLEFLEKCYQLGSAFWWKKEAARLQRRADYVTRVYASYLRILIIPNFRVLYSRLRLTTAAPKCDSSFCSRASLSAVASFEIYVIRWIHLF
jgi:hypothetical protein